LDEHSALREYFARFFEPSTVPDHAACGAFLTKALLSAPLRPRVKRDKQDSLGRAWELAEHRATNGIYSVIFKVLFACDYANQTCFVLVVFAGKYLPACYTEEGFVHFSRRSGSSSSFVSSSGRPQTAPLSATCTLGASARLSWPSTAAVAAATEAATAAATAAATTAAAVDAVADARPQQTVRIYAKNGVHSNVWSALASVPVTSTTAPAAAARKKAARTRKAPVWHDGSVVSAKQHTAKHANSTEAAALAHTAHGLRGSSENNVVERSCQRQRPRTAHAKSDTAPSQQQQQQQQQAKSQPLLTLSRRKRWEVCNSSDISADLTVTNTAHGTRRVTLLSQHTGSSGGSVDAVPTAVKYRRPRTASARMASDANIVVL
jgi:hypothetical protein